MIDTLDEDVLDAVQNGPAIEVAIRPEGGEQVEPVVQPAVQQEKPAKRGLAGVISGKAAEPPIVMVYGDGGIGKSTFASGAPKPIFIDLEKGLGTIGADRFPVVESSSEVESQLSTLLVEDHDYRTVVIDSVDCLEAMMLREICVIKGWKSLADSPYSSYRKILPAYWDRIVNLLKELHFRKRMIIILIAHSQITRVEDPENPAYDMHCPKLEPKTTATLCEWVNAVLYADLEKVVRTVDKKFDQTRSIASPVIGENGGMNGQRILRGYKTPGCTAKNRYGISENIPLSWSAFFKYVQAAWKN